MNEIEFFRFKTGECPTEEFLDSLPSKMAQKVTWVLKIIEEGDIIPAKYFKKLVNTDEIWECRVSFGNNTVRLLAFFDGPRKIILTHGFRKKSQKTPRQEIQRAERYKREYFG